MASPTLTGFQNLKHHEQHFISSADLYVERTLFKVHSHFLTRESTEFEDKVNQLESSGPPNTADRSPSAKVIALDESVSADHFAKLLSIFYPARYGLFNMTVEDWEQVLRLATKWRFEQVQELCVRELGKDSVPIATRLAIFEANNLPVRVTRPLYGILCAEELPLTLAEMERLGTRATYIIMTARERLRSAGEGGRSPLSSERRSDVGPTLRTLFESLSPPAATATTTTTNGSGHNGTTPTPNPQGTAGDGNPEPRNGGPQNGGASRNTDTDNRNSGGDKAKNAWQTK